TMALIEGLVPGAFNPRLVFEYQAYREHPPSWKDPVWPTYYPLHDSSVSSPEAVTANIALAALGGSGGSVLATAAAADATAVGLELRSRVRIGSSWILAGSGWPLGGVGVAAAWIPPELPQE